jgi:hypothetical protein
MTFLYELVDFKVTQGSGLPKRDISDLCIRIKRFTFYGEPTVFFSLQLDDRVSTLVQELEYCFVLSPCADRQGVRSARVTGLLNMLARGG